MLTLTRRLNEKVVITTVSGERIVVTYLKRQGRQIRLGFEASSLDIVINRSELDEPEVRRRGPSEPEVTS